MERIVECVPNFSEGRNVAVLKDITDTIESVSGVRLLDVDPGANTNRTVVTFVGSPEAVAEAAFLAVKRASEVIDMRTHKGEHPRMGATDVLPFVPVSGVTMEDCAELARQVGKRIGEELGIPIYLYENAASRPERRNLARVRSGQYEGLAKKLADPEWKPDFGPAEFNARAGATAVGAREFLVAYNINLNTADRTYANEIVYEIRDRGRWKRQGAIQPFYERGEVVKFPGDGTHPCGKCDHVSPTFEEASRHYREDHGGDLGAYYQSLGIDPENPSGPVYKQGLFPEVKGIGWVIEEYNRAQLSMNLTNYKVSAPHEVLEAARDLARERGIVVTGSEIVGVIPYDAMRRAGLFYLRRMGKATGQPVPDLMETAIQSMGLREVSPFEARDKILGMPQADGPLVNRTTYDFVDEVSRETPAPGGGSVAALAGALGSALASMVANLSVGKPANRGRYEDLCSLAEEAQSIKDALVRGVDEDTQAFDSVLKAMRLPKDTPAQREARDEAIQEGYKSATRVPLGTVNLCRRALELCAAVAPHTDKNMISDVGTGALMAHAGVQAAAYNVRINLPHLRDEAFRREILDGLDATLAESARLAAVVASRVGEVLGAAAAVS